MSTPRAMQPPDAGGRSVAAAAPRLHRTDKRRQATSDLRVEGNAAFDLARAFVEMASDIALLIDDDGTVTAVAQNRQAPMDPSAPHWVGRRWVDCVTAPTRHKIERLLLATRVVGPGHRREVNHLIAGGHELPVAYTALRLGSSGPVLALGRDLRRATTLHGDVLSAQQSLEKGYWRHRHGEAQQRLLQQLADDAVVVIDGKQQVWRRGNAAAAALWQHAAAQGLPGSVSQVFDARSWPTISAQLDLAGQGDRAAEMVARLAGSHTPVSVAIRSLQRAEGPALLLRLRRLTACAPEAEAHHAGAGAGAVAVAVVDSGGRLCLANEAFGRLTHARTSADPLDFWLGAGAAAALLAEARSEGLAPPRHVALRRADGATLAVSATATLLTGSDDDGDWPRCACILTPLLTTPRTGA